MIDAEAIASVLRGLAPSGVTTGAAVVDAAHRSSLTAVERIHVRGAVAARVDEFATGRALLRRLLDRADDIPVLENRAPAFPPGYVGSLAHDDEVAIAAVSAEDRVRAIGVDVERVGAMPADEAAIILRPDETAVDPRLAFVLKEAVYKAWSATSVGLLDFQEVRVSIADDRFRAAIRPGGPTPGPELSGRLARCEGRWLALVVDDSGP